MKILNARLLKEVRTVRPDFDMADVLVGRGMPRSSRRAAHGQNATAVEGSEARAQAPPPAAQAEAPASRNSQQDAALDKPSGPFLWNATSPAPRPSPRTRIVCVPGQISQEEHDARMQVLQREYETLQREYEAVKHEYEALQASMEQLRAEKDALNQECNELRRSRDAAIAGKDRQIKELKEQISRLEDRPGEVRYLYMLPGAASRSPDPLDPLILHLSLPPSLPLSLLHQHTPLSPYVRALVCSRKGCCTKGCCLWWQWW